MDPRAGLDNIETSKFVTSLGLELRPFDRPDRSQPLYQLSYRGSPRVYFLWFLLALSCMTQWL
jgi:hypothetical protein